MEMDALEIQQTEGSTGAVILTLRGSLTMKSLAEFQNLVRKDRRNSVIVDLGDVPYMDSAGLGAILGAFTLCERGHRKFALARVVERVRTLFEVAGVGALLPQYESVEAAERQLGANAAH
jgi:anti-sigma B factor antagonist